MIICKSYNVIVTATKTMFSHYLLGESGISDNIQIYHLNNNITSSSSVTLQSDVGS